MTTFYLICFGVGLGLTVLSVLGGGAHLHLHVGSHHFGGHGLGGHPVAGQQGIAKHSHGGLGSWVNGFTVPAFLCWLGGTGYLLARYSSFAFSLILLLSALSGLAGATVIFLFLARVLLPHERELLLEDTAMEGVLGELTAPVTGAAGIGEIQFTQNGSRRFAPARSATGQPLARGQQVVVLGYAHGVAAVSPWSEETADLEAGRLR